MDGTARPLPLNQAVRARAADPRVAVEQALAVMLDRYLVCVTSGPPVHTWPHPDVTYGR